MWLNGRCFRQIVNRDSGNLYPTSLLFPSNIIFVYPKAGGGGGEKYTEIRGGGGKNKNISFHGFPTFL